MSSTGMIMAEAWPIDAGRAAGPLLAAPGVGWSGDGANTSTYSSNNAPLDIRGFFPLELEHVCSAFSMAQSQILLLSAELAQASRALDDERRLRLERDASEDREEQDREEREERDRVEREELEARIASESHRERLLQSSLDTLREENEALRRGNECDRLARLAVTARLEAELKRLHGDVSRLQEENSRQADIVEKMNVSLRLAENKSRRLEFELQEQDDNELDLRLFLQSSLYTMNKHARAKNQDGTLETAATKNVRVKRLIERVKASDTGIDVTNLSVSDVQGFLSLLVRRMNASSISSC
ncbi:MAG: hypothetical protein ABGY24_00645 [bacterium]